MTTTDITTDPNNARPVQIAPETFVIQGHVEVGGAGVMHVNSMLIRGAEPTVVDTGVPVDEDRFLRDLFALVDPGDVRWLFLSHDDIDHAGNAAAIHVVITIARGHSRRTAAALPAWSMSS